MLTRPWTLLCLLATLTALAVLIPRIIQEASDLVATPPSPALGRVSLPCRGFSGRVRSRESDAGVDR